MKIWNIGKRENSMSLREYLKEQKIDQIEDDAQIVDDDFE